MAIPIPTASSAQDLSQRLAQHRQSVPMSVTVIGLNEVDAIGAAEGPQGNAKLWARQPETGDIARGDQLFFKAVGARIEITPPGAANPIRYKQPLLQEAPPAGTVVLVRDKETGDVLLDIKTEAGADPSRRHTTFSATLQVSSSRLKLMEPAKDSDSAHSLLGVMVGLGLNDSQPIETQEDGGRFFNKRNELHVLEVESKQVFAKVQQASLVWTKPAYVFDEANRNECNAFFWQAMGVLGLKQLAAAT